jgi:BCD family chlorophyll transporter-like MFS transporter
MSKPTLLVLRARQWLDVAPRFLPFADAATRELPLGRLMRLSLFQVTVGMATVLLIGTLNRVMIVEMGMAAWLVSLMVALPLVFAPFRALVGFKSDTHRSVLGWKRVPYIWMGTWLQFGGFAIMPFALILLSGDSRAGPWLGQLSSALAFLMVGAGSQITQTAGLALATDIAPESARPRVVALMYVMLLVGMVISGLTFGLLLTDFSQLRLIKVVQGAAATRQVPRSTCRVLTSAPVGNRSCAKAARCASWSPWAWAPPRSTCRTSFSSPTAGKFSSSRWVPPRC